ncbi:hypothetical protein GCM10008955_24530 [Deinococcus malanensis]|uniref:Uncharacterized protein n=1 Tax=Deinococcus malanensis TaxID=1706855 RepID=A0ABQ2EWK3_9DEIO|nr:hypothetical protein [Deinococcus malanensis]GGK29796.1 hypothetical protein GCM10008955_24530 [Deinococcus malanensis]
MTDLWKLHEAPFPHAPPGAEGLEAQLRSVVGLLRCWRWGPVSPEGITVFLMFDADPTTLRLVVTPSWISADVFCTYIPLDADLLTWVLMRNHLQAWKARAAAQEKGGIPLYLETSFSTADQPVLGRIVWAAYQEGLNWRGEIELRATS